ncbi:MAG: pilus (MSHA type) biogenesis protein MshL [Rubrivivax sp.]|nr:MAG: pilus (MSHA type) biogenesis protein MshL [Rubrivivax sp.]
MSPYRNLWCGVALTAAAMASSVAMADTADIGGPSTSMGGGMSVSLSMPTSLRAEAAAEPRLEPSREQPVSRSAWRPLKRPTETLVAMAMPEQAEAPIQRQVDIALSRPVIHKTVSTPSDASPRFDLAVSNAPASQVFLQLGAGTPYNMLVAPEVTGTITVALKNTTVLEALDSLRELFGYDYRVTGNRVFIYPNAVQTRLFKIDYLPGRRQGTSDLRVSSSAINSTGGNNSANGSASSGSSEGSSSTGGARGDDTSHVRMTSDADFWQEVQLSLATLVGKENGRGVVLNPAAGVVVVKATPAELRQVESYLKTLQSTISRQVMLEAKIIEVQLEKGSQTGVNWSLFRNATGNTKGKVQLGNVGPGITLPNDGTIVSGSDAIINPGSNIITDVLGKGFYGMAFQSGSFAALINFLQTQGNVQVLSSPRIATLNNQKAVLKVGNDELFVTGVTTNTTTSANGGSLSSPTLTLQAFFSGISLDVTPQIDDAGNVMLHVHPAISVVNEKQKVIDLGDLGSFRLPLAASAINETDSIVRLRDGQIVAIGGLMRHEALSERAGVKGLSDLPGVGNLFGQTSNSSSKRELVILIKPTLISPDGRGWSEDEPATPMLPTEPAQATSQDWGR